ncbi:MAG: hypothetical protein U9O54_01225 [Chloroflexota bacterium]|nr:hypothetical protein [Chloroflexota bacterium]
MNKNSILFQRIIILVGLLAMVISPVTALAAGPDDDGEGRFLGIVEGQFEGVVDAHVNMRMADAFVDLVRVRYPAGEDHDAGEVWVVAGVMYYDPTPGFMYQVPGTPFVYLPNGPWMSSSAIDEYLKIVPELPVIIFRYRYDDPRARAEDYESLRRIENLFSDSNVLFWRISILYFQGVHQ